MSANRLLIVDDDQPVGEFIATVARSAGYEAIVTSKADEFLAEFGRWNPTHIATDLTMPGMDGIELLQALAKARSNAAIFIISGFDPTIVNAARRLGTERGLNIVGMLHKPIRAAELKKVFEAARTE